MKNKKRMIIFFSCFVVIIAAIWGVNLFQKQRIQSGYGDTPNSANPYAESVTMLQLIAIPEKYDGELVRVIGVGNLEFEGNYLSLSKEDWEYGVGNQIWIELGERALAYEEAKAYNGEYVIVEGFFDKDDGGHMDMFRGSIKDVSRYELWNVNEEPYTVVQNDDLTYSYEVTAENGTVLFSKENQNREPRVEWVNDGVIGLTTQTGTGLSTSWAVYCDVKNSKTSEEFRYVLTAEGDCVVFVRFENGEHRVVVQNIFDKTAYYQEYVLPNCSPLAGDIVVGAKTGDDGTVTVTYLTGDDYTETEYTVRLP